MIIDALLDFVAWLVETVTGWLPVIEPPAWFGDVGDGLQTIFTAASSMGVWLPVPLALGVAGVVLACVLAGLIIKVVRIVASFVTVGGGSAG